MTLPPLRREPPHRIAFTWHPGHADGRGAVEVGFAPVDDGRTLVTVVHIGWESCGAAAAEAGEDYGDGWPAVLGAYGAALET